MKRRVLLLLACCFSWMAVFSAPAERSDTLDIRKTIIHFNITDFITKNIYGQARLLIKSEMNNINQINLDLKSLTVDSVQLDNLSATFTHTGELLQIATNTTMNQNDSVWVDVFYHGIPSADATLGGFNYVSNYAFQLGVGFDAQPHSFGRTWMPCFDNMVERSAYEFFITTTGDKMAVCNGLFIDSVLNSNGQKTWHWKLDEEIPSYLACVAVSNYQFVKKVLNANQGTMNAWIACEPSDSNKVNGSFAHLQESFSMLENHFGDYVFPRVGYSLVPFNGGAMEHATNIAIGKVFIDGTLNYETLIAHELSHHWFGDDMTCSTVQDMWLNEGFASYCENLHLESVYGHEAYQEEMRSKHYTTLFRAHVDDDGYKAVSPMDSLNTYGTTVYIKGADVLHSLRTYLGDALFFSGIKNFVSQNHFKPVNSFQLRDALSAFTGQNLNNFFSNWIFSPGFTHFSIDSIQTVYGGSAYNVSVFIRQRKHQAPNYFSNVPLEIAFYDSTGQVQMFPFIFDGRCMEFKVQLPFQPAMVWLDPEEKISDAITENTKVITSLGTVSCAYAKCNLIIKALLTSSDSSIVRVAHHWVAPDRFKSATSFPGYVLNDKRYWSVGGLNLQNLKGWIKFDYNGTSGNNFIDSSWIKNTEDSIRLFYRKDATEEWQFANDSLVAGGLNDKVGYVLSKEIKAGEFCLGIKRSNYLDTVQNDFPSGPCSIVTQAFIPLGSASKLDIYPNPTADQVHIKAYFPNSGLEDLWIYDLTGNVMHHERIRFNAQGQCDQFISLGHLKSGLYFLQIKNENLKLVIQ